MGKLGVLVVGPGWVAGQHLKAYLLNPHTEIRAVAGVLHEDRDRAHAYMESLGFKCPYFDDYETALNRSDTQIVSVCTINHLHYSQTLAALEAGKHVLVEKPLCFTAEEASRLAAEAQSRKLITHVGHVVRFYPAIVGLHSLVESGELGEIFYCESGYWHEIIGAWKTRIETGGSALLMGGCHAVDMVRWMLGESNPIDEVSAYSTPARRRTDFEYPPTVTLTMKYRNESIGRVSTCLESRMPYVFHLQVNGTKGSIRNNGFFSDRFPSRGFSRLEADYPDDWNVSHHPFPEEINSFVDCIRQDRPSGLSFQEAVKTYEVIFAAEHSIQSGKPVQMPFIPE